MQSNFQEILKRKREHYGNTEAAIEFAAEEFLRQELSGKDKCSAQNHSLHVNMGYGKCGDCGEELNSNMLNSL